MSTIALGQKFQTGRPPDKGSFPLDHLGECNDAQQNYLQCLSRERSDSRRCRTEAKMYLRCRMDKNLMRREKMTNLGFRSDGEDDEDAAERRQREELEERKRLGTQTKFQGVSDDDGGTAEQNRQGRSQLRSGVELKKDNTSVCGASDDDGPSGEEDNDDSKGRIGAISSGKKSKRETEGEDGGSVKVAEEDGEQGKIVSVTSEGASQSSSSSSSPSVCPSSPSLSEASGSRRKEEEGFVAGLGAMPKMGSSKGFFGRLIEGMMGS